MLQQLNSADTASNCDIIIKQWKDDAGNRVWDHPQTTSKAVAAVFHGDAQLPPATEEWAITCFTVLAASKEANCNSRLIIILSENAMHVPAPVQKKICDQSSLAVDRPSPEPGTRLVQILYCSLFTAFSAHIQLAQFVGKSGMLNILKHFLVNKFLVAAEGSSSNSSNNFLFSSRQPQLSQKYEMQNRRCCLLTRGSTRVQKLL